MTPARYDDGAQPVCVRYQCQRADRIQMPQRHRNWTPAQGRLARRAIALCFNEAHRDPQLRSHRIDSDEFYRLLEGEVIDDANLFAELLQQWEDHYNYDRPHGALSGQTPYERLKQKARDPLS